MNQLNNQSETQPMDSRNSLLLALLNEQNDFSAVEQFSRFHDENHELDRSRYSNLLPVSSPKEGQQYSFEVDLDACSGCKACVTACHNMNGLDEKETWRTVGILHGGTTENPFHQHVTSACHHCLEPACMIGCPVDAYEKDPVTGIVKHLDDQCIGCQYCTLACPYDVPQYNPEKGIVRKCDMCSDRLAEGEAPACVQSCPNEAISIQIIDKEKIIEDSESGSFLPGTIDPLVTLPTTTFRSNSVFPRNLLPADYYSTSTEHAHWPLIVMLVLIQMSVGIYLFGSALNHLESGTGSTSFQWWQSVFGLTICNIALLSSLFHLGRPHLAFRAVIGLKHSWLSREIVVFSLFAFLASLFTAYHGLLFFKPDFGIIPSKIINVLGDILAGTGIIGVICSIMIYQFTKRELWNGMITSIKFLMSMIILGLSSTLVTLSFMNYLKSESMNDSLFNWMNLLVITLSISTTFKLMYEASIFFHLKSQRNSPYKRAANLMVGDISNITKIRFVSGLIGGIFFPLLLLESSVRIQSESGITPLIVSVLALSLCLVGELLERYIYFVAVSPAGMPGGIKA